MNNEKIGLFISEMRKACGMTQKDLGERLNVTDKAVSKWERGLSYPDIALLLPLSQTLGITVNELLSGEKSEDEEAEAAINVNTDTAVINVLNYADKAVKSKTRSTRRRWVLAMVGAAFIIFALVVQFYPAFSSWYNGRVQRGIVMGYSSTVETMPQADIDEHFYRAERHNAALAAATNLQLAHWAVLPEDYFSILSVDGVISRVEIPAISVDLPIFHGTTTSLQKGAGHLEGTAFPIGGVGNHAVITAHSSSAYSRMFMNLRELQEGDRFYITTLDRRLVYQVDRIDIIEPYEAGFLQAVPDEDIVTLMTCYPWGINSHRLLVRGVRVE